MPSTSEKPRPVEVRRVARIPLGLIVALVVLRLCTGWHFYREGTKKLSYNPETGEVGLAFSAEGMLRKAVGPLAATIRSELPNFHSWESELAKPWQIRSLSEKEEQELQAWEADYAARQKEAKEKGEAPLFEFSPRLSYSQWANHVVKDWQATVDAVKAIPGMSEAQQKAAQAAMDGRRSQLADYLAGEATAIAEWQHELYRLDQWESSAGATGIPFEIDRIKEKRSETAAASAPWIAEVRSIQSGLYHDLRQLQNAEQAGDAAIRSQYDALLADAQDVQLHRLNLAVTGLIIGVGVCLVLGLFTRLAALGGALFLISVIATQPPWVPGAMTDVFYYQLVEIAGLAVLFASSAGRWAGLDFFLHALFGRCCGRKESV
jgi:uncharacterized membrane protein YphA (DoxX/SURF4 family)